MSKYFSSHFKSGKWGFADTINGDIFYRETYINYSSVETRVYLRISSKQQTREKIHYNDCRYNFVEKINISKAMFTVLIGWRRMATLVGEGSWVRLSIWQHPGVCDDSCPERRQYSYQLSHGHHC